MTFLIMHFQNLSNFKHIEVTFIGPPRYGKKEGFKNLTLKRVHDVGTRFQQQSDISLHENVVEYEEDRYCTEQLSWGLHETTLIQLVVCSFSSH